MGFRFQKRITLFPGVRLNLSKSGTSWSFGPRGLSVNVKDGKVTGTAGIPGTGLSYREQLNKKPRTTRTSTRRRVQDDTLSSPQVQQFVSSEEEAPQVRYQRPQTQQQVDWETAKANCAESQKKHPVTWTFLKIILTLNAVLLFTLIMVVIFLPAGK